MQKAIFTLISILLLNYASGQGIDSIFVEQIPVSAEAIAEDPNLNASSIAYRVFVSMKPGYKVNSVTGGFSNPLLIKTTTGFYNHEEGDIQPLYKPIPGMDEALYYDSWFTIGEYGKRSGTPSVRSQLVPLAEDISDGIQNGIVLGAVTNKTDPDPVTNFENMWGYEMGPSADFGTEGYNPENVLWYAAGGVGGIGPSNSVCIGQFTTDGEFSMELGLRIAPPSGPAQYYVVRHKIADEQILTNMIIYPPNNQPTIDLTSPEDGDIYEIGDQINIAATALDTDGTITSVTFFVNGSPFGTYTEAPFSTDYTVDRKGAIPIYAVTVDDRYGRDTTGVVNIYAYEPPTVSIASPLEGATYELGEQVPLVAEAESVDGDVTKVEFYVNDELVSTDNEAPFSYNWTADEAGIKEIAAKVYDDLDGVATSAIVTITVNVPGNNLPVVNITSPGNGDVFTVGESISLEAEASDEDVDDHIVKVEFFADGSKIGESLTAPFELEWTSSDGGSKTLTAQATDNRGGTGVSPAITIIHNYLPYVIISSPANGAIFTSGDDIVILATATDQDGTISKVELWVDDVYEGDFLPVSGNDFSYTLNTNYGNKVLKAVATDNYGGTFTSQLINITVNANLPTVSIVAPVNGATYLLGEQVTLVAEAESVDGEVTKVEFYINDELVSTITEAPYSTTWLADEAGTKEIVAKVYNDLDGVATSDIVTITINVPGNNPPVVNITFPSDGEVFNLGESITIQADATDEDPDDQIVKVEFFSNGNKIGESLTAPFELEWTSPDGGSKILTAQATDNRGGTGISPEISITYNILPEVVITSPADGAIFTLGDDILVLATASDEDGTITKVELMVDDVYAGDFSPVAGNDFTFTLNTGQGSKVLKAVATDNNGGTLTSETITITINPHAPTVSIISPLNGATYELGEQVNLLGEAESIDGEITKVEFYINDELVSTLTEAPYSTTWTADEAGAKEIVAKVYDDLDGIAISEAVTITVNAPENNLPVVNITSPDNGDIFTVGESITIVAEATDEDEDDQIVKVEFFANGEKIGESLTSPYELEWTSLEGGTKILTAQATDNRGGTGISPEISITFNILPEVAITSPAAGSTFTVGDDIVILATATDEDGTITKVELLVDDVPAGNFSPVSGNDFTFTLNLPQGNKVLKAVATDNNGGTFTSQTINITVNAQIPATVVDIISSSADHTTLENALTQADLIGTLSGDGPFTVFAPTDDAFAALPAGLLDELLADPSGDLSDVLLFHVIAANALSTSLTDGQLIATLFGENVTVDINDEGIFINNAEVTLADIVAANGVVHVIDAVLVPTTLSSENGFGSKGHINIYPNPVRNSINIKATLTQTSYVSVEIYNIVGKMVMSINLGNTEMIHKTLDVSSLPQGIYILNIRTGNEVISRKINVVR